MCTRVQGQVRLPLHTSAAPERGQRAWCLLVKLPNCNKWTTRLVRLRAPPMTHRPRDENLCIKTITSFYYSCATKSIFVRNPQKVDIFVGKLTLKTSQFGTQAIVAWGTGTEPVDSTSRRQSNSVPQCRAGASHWHARSFSGSPRVPSRPRLSRRAAFPSRGSSLARPVPSGGIC